jgi:hypothetical protein
MICGKLIWAGNVAPMQVMRNAHEEMGESCLMAGSGVSSVEALGYTIRKSFIFLFHFVCSAGFG